MKKTFSLKLIIPFICLGLFACGCIGFFPSIAAAQQSNTIKIGAMLDLSGTYTTYGVQIKRTTDFITRETNEKGGLLGKKIEFVIEDAASDPAIGLRRARKLVESDKVKFLMGFVGSDQVLAILEHLPKWNAIYLASVNGAGSLTAKDFTPNFFRAGHSAPMAARTIRLFIEESPYKKFMAVASDYVYGHSAVDSFEKEVKGIKKEFKGGLFPPLGNKDYSSWIARVKREKVDVLYTALTGEDHINFFKQAKGYGLLQEVQVILEQVNLNHILPAGEAMIGTIGSSRYSFTLDNPLNKSFVQKFQAMFNEYPDMADGETYHSMAMLFKAIEKAGTAEDVPKIIKSYEGLEYTGIKGKVTMRACDHQGVNDGVLVKVVKSPNFSFPIPEIVKIYPGEKITPPCKKAVFD
jgi:branched-chain amino acid transport system substrate-binding protein